MFEDFSDLFDEKDTVNAVKKGIEESIKLVVYAFECLVKELDKSSLPRNIKKLILENYKLEK